jgi:hypothetical protein
LPEFSEWAFLSESIPVCLVGKGGKMKDPRVESVTLERLRNEAICVILRLALGLYELQGPLQNLLIPESYVAWSTVKSALENEGYDLVTPNDYASACGVEISEVMAQIYDQGSLFALIYKEFIVVPLPEKAVGLPGIQI